MIPPALHSQNAMQSCICIISHGARLVYPLPLPQAAFGLHESHATVLRCQLNARFYDFLARLPAHPMLAGHPFLPLSLNCTQRSTLWQSAANAALRSMRSAV